MNTLALRMSVIAALALFISSCGSASTSPAPSTPGSPTDVPPGTTVATAVPPTPTASKDVAVSANGVDLIIPDGLGTGVKADVIPEVSENANGAPWDVAPVHYKFTLLGYPLAGPTNFEPTLLVYPAKEYAQVSTGAASDLEVLRTALATPSATLTKDTLPSIPFFNAALIMASNARSVAFQNGAGVRALTHYAQAPTAVTNDFLIYEFQGLSADGKYYLIGTFPVSAPFLQANEQAPVPADGVALPTDVSAYDSYLATVADRLTAAEQDGTLTPTLSMLDAFVGSIKLNSPTIIQPGASADCSDQATFKNEELPQDNTAFAPNAQFVKQWTIYNTGTCSWNAGYTWVYVSGDQMGGTDLKLENSIAVSNGGVTVLANLTAPAQPGTFTGYWGLRDGAGRVVPIVGGTKDNTLFVQIVVTSP